MSASACKDTMDALRELAQFLEDETVNNDGAVAWLEVTPKGITLHAVVYGSYGRKYEKRHTYLDEVFTMRHINTLKNHTKGIMQQVEVHAALNWRHGKEGKANGKSHPTVR